jgi:hypothetical protein
MNEYDKYTRHLELTNGDPWRIASLRVSKQKYAAKTRNLDWTLNYDVVVKKIANSTHCALSGRELVFEVDNIDSPSIDRKKNHLGYTPRNIQIVTSAVNKAKNTLSDQEFIEMCCNVAEKHGWINPNKPIMKE